MIVSCRYNAETGDVVVGRVTEVGINLCEAFPVFHEKTLPLASATMSYYTSLSVG